MNVSELARRTGLTAKAVRFYETEGIVPPAPRAANGYREYDDEDVCRMRLISTLRGMGLALADSGRLAELCVSDQCDVMETQLIDLVRARREEISVRQSELEHLESELSALEQGLIGTAPKRNLCAGREVC